ncbi:Hypothetical protein A7982_08629 [Minicystis rosea]|nr:Hypothetical protein A7982_08629 [Minicystis rosea]
MAWQGWRQSETRGVLIAGRSYDFSDFTRAQVVAICETIDAIASSAGLGIAAVPADIDLSDDNTGDEDPAYCSAFIGILAAEGGTYEPLEVTREAMLRAEEEARAIPAAIWDRITAAYREAGGKQASDDAIVTRLGCTGPLPLAKLAFGVLGKADDALGGTFVRGQNPSQEPHEIGVHGLRITGCSYDGSPADPIDVGDDAHAARVAESPKGSYYLIAHFD